MTLHFFRDTKPDNRMIEYDQAVVRLGLEKAAAERELDRVKKELIEIENRKISVCEDVERIRTEIPKAEKELAAVREEIQNAVLDEAKDLADLREQKKKSAGGIEEYKQEFLALENHLRLLGMEIVAKNIKIEELQKITRDTNNELIKVQSELSPAKREVEEIQKDIQSLYQLKIEVDAKMNAINAERRETEEIVAMLKANNKEGLELVASFEGERKRLRDKEEFLRRKEDDLAVYEKRLKKRCEEVGYNVDMKFT